MPCKRLHSGFACLSAAALLLAGPAIAQSGTASSASGSASQASGSAGQASAADKKFVTKAMQGGMAEVQLGQLASQKASSQEVKDFGQKMVDDHTKLNEQMTPIAAQLGLTPPTELYRPSTRR